MGLRITRRACALIKQSSPGTNCSRHALSRREVLRPRQGRVAIRGAAAVMLLVYVAPAGSSLAAWLAHRAFHLTQQMAQQHQFRLGQPPAKRLSAQAHGPRATSHTHGPGARPHVHGTGEAAHTHAAAVDLLLRVAGNHEATEVGPTSSGTPQIDDYIPPSLYSMELKALAFAAAVPWENRLHSAASPRPPVPPPRG